jgi:DNA gyrase subunit A
MPVIGISEQGRATQGVKLIRLDEGDAIAAITKLDENVGNGNGNGDHLEEIENHLEENNNLSPENKNDTTETAE